MRYQSGSAFVLLLILYICSDPAGAAGDNPPEYDAPGILGFSRQLISRKEYYRAYVELARLESYYPNYLNSDVLFASRLHLLFQGKQYQKLVGLDHASPFRCIESVYRADAYLMLSEYEEALRLCAAPCANEGDPMLRRCRVERMMLSSVMMQKIDEARDILKSNGGDFGDDTGAYEDMLKYSEENVNRIKKPYRSLICGIVPGMGYTYAGNYQTGIIAFAMISVLSTLTYFSFTTDNKPLAIFFGLGATFFYGGSMIGGYRETVRYNRQIMERVRENLYQGMQFEEDKEKIFTRYGIMGTDAKQ